MITQLAMKLTRKFIDTLHTSATRTKPQASLPIFETTILKNDDVSFDTDIEHS